LNALVLLAIFVAAFGLFAVAMFYYMKFLTRVMVHRDAELLAQILADGEVPCAWSRKYCQRIATLESLNACADKIEKIDARARAHYLRKLRRIVSYAQGTPLLTDEEKRSALIRLEEVSAQWKGDGEQKDKHPSCV